MKLIYDIIPPSELKTEKTPKKHLIRGAMVRIVVLLLIIGLNWTGLSCLIGTRAYLSDIETSSNNIYTASNLDFSLDSPPDFAPEVIPEQESTRSINVQNDGILDFQYKVKVENPDGDLCDYLNLADDLSSVSQPLISFISEIAGIATKSNWLFTAGLTDNIPSIQFQTCDFELVFIGWQDDFIESGPGFSDEERITNRITSGKWLVSQGDVVINELMWMGSFFNTNDEWLELRNMKDYPIDISGWQLTKLVGCEGNSQEALMLEIGQGTIPANGFFLVSNFDKDTSRINVDPNLIDENVYLRDCGLQVKLYKGDWQDPENLIDTADSGSHLPAAGYHGWFFHLSMERDDIPGDGQLSRNWHTCFDYYNTRQYWDNGDIFNLGTPGAANLSEESIEFQEALLAQYIRKEKELLAQGETPDLLLEEISEEEEPIDEPVDTPIDEPIEQPLDEPITEEETINEPVEEQPVEELPAPDEEPVIKEEPVIIPENPAIQDDNDDKSGDNEDSADNSIEETESVEIPVVAE